MRISCLARLLSLREGCERNMADDRLKSGAERRTVAPPEIPPPRESTIIRRHRNDEAPPSSCRRLQSVRTGDAACALCARRASAGLAAALTLGRTSCQFLAATWIVLTLGDPPR